MRLTQFVNVEPMTTRGGNASANQLIMSDPHGETFVSYGSKICYRSFDKYGPERRPKYVFDEYYWDYSRTTSKYRNEFLGFGVAECRKGIKEGWIKLTDLNKKK